MAAIVSLAEKRLYKELMELIKNPPACVTVNKDLIDMDILKWIINIEGAEGTLYEGEKFELQFQFNYKYPHDSPVVVFVGENIPVHPQVYSNGHICLSTLTEDWTPEFTVEAVCVSVLDILSSCKEKKPPTDNESYIKTASSNPKRGRLYNKSMDKEYVSKFTTLAFNY